MTPHITTIFDASESTERAPNAFERVVRAGTRVRAACAMLLHPRRENRVVLEHAPHCVREHVKNNCWNNCWNLSSSRSLSP
jgi:hypothetical protein